MRRGYSDASEEVIALREIINFGSLSHVVLNLSSIREADVNTDCGMYSSSGELLGDIFPEVWLTGRKSCGDIKHVIGLYLTSVLSGDRADINIPYREKIVTLDDHGFYSAVSLWSKYMEEVSIEGWNTFMRDVEREGIIVRGGIESLGKLEGATSGKLVDTTHFEIVGAWAGYLPPETTMLEEFFDNGVIISSRPNELNFLDAWKEGEIVFVSNSGDMISGTENIGSLNTWDTGDIASVYSELDEFLHYSYLTLDDYFRSPN